MIIHLETESYKQFQELCLLCQDQKTIGLAYGCTGAGKSEAARKLSKWSTVEPNITGMVQAEDLYIP